MGRSTTSLIVRFLSKVRVPSADPGACWEWIGARLVSGYGYLGAGGCDRRWLRAHRVAWEIANGPIPPGGVIRHKCDNALCVRPSHLELGTQADNVHDMASRNRGNGSKLGLPRGVAQNKLRWMARAKKYLGTFDTIEEAAAVAQREHERLYG